MITMKLKMADWPSSLQWRDFELRLVNQHQLKVLCKYFEINIENTQSENPCCKGVCGCEKRTSHIIAHAVKNLCLCQVNSTFVVASNHLQEAFL